MVKQSRDFPAPSPLEKSREISGDWKDIWTEIAKNTQQSMMQQMQDSARQPLTLPENILFDPEIIASTFTGSLANLTASPENRPAASHPAPEEGENLLHPNLGTSAPDGQPLLGKQPVGKQSGNHKYFDLSGPDDQAYFSLLQQSHRLNIRFLKEAGHSRERLDPQTRRNLSTYIHHLADVLSPLNSSSAALPPFLPQASKHATTGAAAAPKIHFQPGKDVAATPGKVVFQNSLFQLVHYAPLTSHVAAIPLLIIPPFDYKHYIFDLKPETSFIKWCVESGLTVFILSWANAEDEKSMADYVIGGVRQAIDRVCALTGARQANAVAYGTGGILLTCLMAYLGANRDDSVASATLLATPCDFSKADPAGIYRSPHQHRSLEEYAESNKSLSGHYMAEVLNLLHLNDLIWSPSLNSYLLGGQPFPFDILQWLCDPLQVPPGMHRDFLQQLVIENRLIQPGSLIMEDVALDCQEISTPLCLVAAHEDLIAPWTSVYPLTQLARAADQKFLLAGSGHATGIFNHPAHQKYHYWTASHLPADPAEWLSGAQQHAGSWWHEWRQWLTGYGGGAVPARPVPI